MTGGIVKGEPKPKDRSLDIRVHFNEQVREGHHTRKMVLQAIEEMESPDIGVVSVSGPAGTNDTIIVVDTEERKVTHTQLTELRKLIEKECFSSDEKYKGVADLEVVR